MSGTLIGLFGTEQSPVRTPGLIRRRQSNACYCSGGPRAASNFDLKAPGSGWASAALVALVEQGILACKLKEDAPDPDRRRASIAIIGGGFAGLTAAAALIKKGVDADITIFEHCDTLLRQDRILEELIVRRPALHKAVKALRENFPESKSSMFAAFEALDHEPEFQPACDALKRRLRRDTDAILHLKKRMLAELFDDAHLKIAFQNRLLIYLLYKCGGFVPSCTEIPALAQMHSIPDAQIVRRHGTLRDENLALLLSDRARG
jgi:hypothetical protein